MASFSSSSKKQNFVRTKKNNRRERDTTEKEKSPNCLMYHYKKRGFKRKKRIPYILWVKITNRPNKIKFVANESKPI